MLMINPAFHDAFVIILGTLILVSLLTASRLITHIPEELDESRKATENLWMLRWTRNVSYGSGPGVFTDPFLSLNLKMSVSATSLSQMLYKQSLLRCSFVDSFQSTQNTANISLSEDICLIRSKSFSSSFHVLQKQTYFSRISYLH